MCGPFLCDNAILTAGLWDIGKELLHCNIAYPAQMSMINDEKYE